MRLSGTATARNSSGSVASGVFLVVEIAISALA
jgi:hypothetical protein